MSGRLAHLLAGAAAITFAAAAVAAPDPGLIWHPVVEVAHGPAEQGPWRQSQSRYDYVDDGTVAVDGDGGLAVAWVDQARKAVLLQRLTPAGAPLFAQPVDVSRQPATFSWLPRLAFAPDAPAQLYVAWQEIVFSGGSHGGEIFFARSSDGGATFGTPLNLSRSKGGDGKGRIDRDTWHNGSFDLAAGPDGVVHAAWTEYGGALWHSRSTDGGQRFSPPRRIAGSDRVPARAPSLAVGRDGAVHLAWTVGDDPGADIRLAVSRDGGATFGTPRIVGPGRGWSDAPKLAVAPDGVVHLVYAQSTAGPSGLAHVRHARSPDGGRTFSAPREISAPMPAGAVGASFPSLALDARGNVVVTWELAQAAGQQPLGLAITVSRDGGGSFTPPALVPHSVDPRGGVNGSRQGLLMKKLALGEQGAIAVVNSSFQAGVRSRVWLMRGNLQR